MRGASDQNTLALLLADSLYTFRPSLGRLGSVLPTRYAFGLHRVHPVFDPPLDEKLRYACMYFSVTVCTDEYTFIKLSFYSFPRTSKSSGRQPEVLLFRISVMEIKSLCASIIATYCTLVTFVFSGHYPELLATLSNSLL